MKPAGTDGRATNGRAARDNTHTVVRQVAPTSTPVTLNLGNTPPQVNYIQLLRTPCSFFPSPNGF